MSKLISVTAVIGLLFFIFIITAGLTWIVYRRAVRRNWLAIPNERSSHLVPTPTGAGIAIAVVSLLSVLILGILNIIDMSVTWALFGGGIMVATVGWIDVHHSLKARYRIFIHFAAALWALWFLGGLPDLDIGIMKLFLGIMGSILGLLWIIGFSNLYNFMDGIDGLIGSETVVVGSLLGILFALSGIWDLALISWILAVSTAGFLIWNWHPAKIFMGDVGSVLLGFSFAVLAISSEHRQALPGLLWVLLFGVVIVDAGLITLRRAFRGEKWFEAHRAFGYHRAVQLGYRHDQVVVRAMGISSILAIIGFIVWLKPMFLIPAIGFAYLVLAWIWFRLQKPFVT